MFNKILITGANGFLGHHIIPQLRQAFPGAYLAAVGRQDYDLLEQGTVARMFQTIRPDCVVHLAAMCGGIHDNRQRPADYFYQNLMMNTAVFQESFRCGVRKFLTLIGGCAYPDGTASLLREDQIWAGYPTLTSAGYSMAKKMMLVQSWAYRQQHGFNSVVLIPGNVYGEWDNFAPARAHVIPSLLRKYLDAKDQKQAEITAFGTGRPTRDFVYAGDVAATIPWFLAHYSSSDPINISSGMGTSIRELAETIKEVTGFPGRIVWDTAQPDGQMEKVYDVSRLQALGLSCSTTLKAGLQKTAAWYIQKRQEGILTS